MTPGCASIHARTLHPLRDLKNTAETDVISKASFKAYSMDSQAHVGAAVETGVADWLSGMLAGSGCTSLAASTVH